MKGILNWIDQRFPLYSFWKAHFSNYYLPGNLNFLYFFGAFAVVILTNQFFTGLWLAMFYTPSTAQAFSSIEFLMRDVQFGWLFRYMHSTGASALFIVLYMHLFRGLLYGSYQKPRELVWLLGMALFVVIMMEAFLGYLLPWGQMSYWGAEVITSLLGAIPVIGKQLMIWIRGDFSVSNITLHRFFALHVIGIVMLMFILVFLHIVALHRVGSNNPEGVEIQKNRRTIVPSLDGIPFHPYYLIKDFLAVIGFLIVFFAIVFFAPEMGGYFLEHTNYLPANSLVTPEHIAPVWYMAPFYSILRAIPHKLFGIFLTGSAVFMPFLLPWLDKSSVRSMRYKGMYSRVMLSCCVVSFIILGYIGTEPVSYQRLIVARICIVFYFAYYLLMPWYTRIERPRQLPIRTYS